MLSVHAVPHGCAPAWKRQLAVFQCIASRDRRGDRRDGRERQRNTVCLSQRGCRQRSSQRDGLIGNREWIPSGRRIHAVLRLDRASDGIAASREETVVVEFQLRRSVDLSAVLQDGVFPVRRNKRQLPLYPVQNVALRLRIGRREGVGSVGKRSRERRECDRRRGSRDERIRARLRHGSRVRRTPPLLDLDRIFVSVCHAGACHCGCGNRVAEKLNVSGVVHPVKRAVICELRGRHDLRRCAVIFIDRDLISRHRRIPVHLPAYLERFCHIDHAVSKPARHAWINICWLIKHTVFFLSPPFNPCWRSQAFLPSVQDHTRSSLWPFPR